MISFNAFMLVYDKRTTPSHRQRNLSSEIAGLLVFNFRAWEYKREFAPQAMDQLLVSDGFQPTPVDHGWGSKGSQKTPTKTDCNAPSKHVSPRATNHGSASDKEGLQPTQRGHGAASGQDGNTHGDGNGSQPTPEDYGPAEAALTRWLDVEHKLKNMNKKAQAIGAPDHRQLSPTPHHHHLGHHGTLSSQYKPTIIS